MNSEYMTPWQLIFLMFVVGLVYLFITVGKWPFIEFWRWLKGSRRSYYLCPSKKEMLLPTEERLRTYEDRDLFTERKYDIGGLIIEIGRGLFRRSGIYGQVLPHWQIKRVWSVKNLGWPLGDWVSLIDNEGLPVGKALQLINAYPSLQAMLDENETQKNRIAELEKELTRAEDKRKQWWATIKAVLCIINEDKPRYRSTPARHIREYLESVNEIAQDLGEPQPSESLVERAKNSIMCFI